MAPEELRKQLEETGKRLRAWDVQLTAMRWGAIALATLFLLGLMDFLLAFSRPSRAILWIGLLALIVFACRLVVRKWRAPMTAESVAAGVEHAFPQLDNHLINTLQFGRSSNGDEFVKAYLRQEVSGWETIDVANMRNRKAHRMRGLTLGGACLLILFPMMLSATPWTTALWRIVNPFSDIPPVTLTRIVDVTPGSVELLQNNPLVIVCSVKGHAGHNVRIDVVPSDDSKRTYNIGELKGGRLEAFTNRMPKVTTSLKYRIRAGDARPSTWFTVSTRPALALTALAFEVTPPTYTRAASRTFDGLSDDVLALEGSQVSLSLAGNQPFSQVEIKPGLQNRLRLVSGDDGNTWTGSFTARADATLAYTARNRHGESLEGTVALNVNPDRAPIITITRPIGRTLLRQGIDPTMSFVVDDDYELADVRIERSDTSGINDEDGIPVKTWQPAGKRIMEMNWNSAGEPTRSSPDLAYRIVATDASPLGERVTRSPLILFDTGADGATLEAEGRKHAQSLISLKHIIDLQQHNLDETRELVEAQVSGTADQWNASAIRQEEIRRLARTLIVSPVKTLGSLAPTMKKLYNAEMHDVIGELKRVPALKGDAQQRTAERSVALEETILRRLNQVIRAAAATDKRRQVADVLAALEALVNGETAIIESTEKVIGKSLPVLASLVERQDDLAYDVSDFASFCRERASTLEHNNAKFAELIRQVALRCESDKVKTDMLRAAETLERNKPGSALPHERKALEKLAALQAVLKKWQVAEAQEGLEDVLEALSDARSKIEKIRKLQEKLLAAMEQIKPNLNKGSKEADLFEEEIEEMQKQLKQAALKIPVDLHIFSEMTVANELVEDIATVFESVEQREGSEHEGAEITEEVGHLKPEEFIEMMKTAEERLDDLEMWLRDDPEEWDFNNEAFDQEEMGKMAMVELPTSLEDIISDLLDETKALDEESVDSASNQGVPDFESGWEISEGPTVSHAAKGKSGNQRPDHKEQDGRSLVGRQGMSSGETAAGGGTISEGDEDIEARRTTDPTQAGHVQVEGDAEENATGGGKQGSGSADDYGMTGKGGDQRMDSTGAGSWEGLASLMARTDAVHIRASLLNLRTESLGAAAHHMKQADDAIATGLPIQAVREHQRRAIQALKSAQTELEAGVSVGISSSASDASMNDATLGASDEAPDEYRDLVAEYFRSLSETM